MHELHGAGEACVIQRASVASHCPAVVAVSLLARATISRTSFISVGT